MINLMKGAQNIQALGPSNFRIQNPNFPIILRLKPWPRAWVSELRGHYRLIPKLQSPNPWPQSPIPEISDLRAQGSPCISPQSPKPHPRVWAKLIPKLLISLPKPWENISPLEVPSQRSQMSELRGNIVPPNQIRKCSSLNPKLQIPNPELSLIPILEVPSPSSWIWKLGGHLVSPLNPWVRAKIRPWTLKF